MKFTLGKEQLLIPLQLVHGIVERRQTLPILSNVLIRLHQGKLQITATDLEVELTATAEISAVKQDAEFTVPARKLLDIVRTLPEDTEITFQVDGDKVQLTAGRARFTLATLPAEEFPGIDLGTSPISLTLEQNKLKRLLESTHFSMAQQDVRYYLNGMLFELQPDRLRVAATDGHRMALNEIQLSTGVDEPLQVIIPRKTIIEIVRLLEDEEAPATVQLGKDQFVIEFGNILFKSKVIDGSFPDYGRVIPAPADNVVKANRASLRQVLSRVSVLSNEKYRAVRLHLTSGETQVHASNTENEEASESFEVNYSGPEMDVGFNVTYLIDVLNAMHAEEIELHLSDPSSSTLILSPGDDLSRYVIMPMRL